MSTNNQSYITKLKEGLSNKCKSKQSLSKSEKGGPGPDPAGLVCFFASLPRIIWCYGTQSQVTTTPSVLRLTPQKDTLCPDYDGTTGIYNVPFDGAYLINFRFKTEKVKQTAGLTFLAQFYGVYDGDESLVQVYSDTACCDTKFDKALEISGNFRVAAMQGMSFFVKLSVSSGTITLAGEPDTFMEIMPLNR